MSSNGSPEAGAGEAPRVFSRSASGLVRDLSLWDAMWFGILASGLFFSFVYFFPYPQFITPGINTPLMLLIATVCTVPIAIVYAGLGSAMPRAGGDYLFQSRSIAPAVGFIIPFGWAALLWTIFFPLTASVIVANGLSPFLVALADNLDASALADFAEWMSTTAGQLVVTLAFSVAAWAITVKGVALYRKVQQYFFIPAVVITFVTFVVVLLFTSTSSFQESFNEYPANAAAGVTVESIMETARAEGWQPPQSSFSDTILWVPILMGAIPFAVFAAEGMLGEIKGVRNFRRLAWTFVIGAFTIGIVVLGFIYFLFEQTASKEFLSAASYVYNTGAMEMPVDMNLASMTGTVSSSALLALALGLGFIASAFQLMIGIFMNVTRMLVSMGLDRSLPPAISKINPSTHSPVFAATLYLALLTLTSIFFITSPDWYTPLVTCAAISGLGILLFSCLAAITLPLKNRQLYESSPIANHRIFGLPLLTVAGVLGFTIQLISWIVIMTNDKLGVTGAGMGLKFDPRLVVLSPLVIAAIVYFGWKAIERNRGVDSSLAFKEIPPE